MRTKNILSWLLFVGLLAVLTIGVLNFQDISDWWKLRNYQPDARIVQLADDTTMDDGTRRVFYINHPELDEKQEFKGRCNTAEQTIVLGCFIENKGIYLLNVTDERLEGVLEVTAAHETLHAMYARLDESERAKVDKMTADYFATITDERIKSTVENYRAKDPGVVPNELHSILATEVRSLSPELEQYYSQYFKDRKKIVSYSEDYEQAFVDIETKGEQYDARLADLKQRIDANKSDIDALGVKIDNEQKRLDALLAANRVDEYNQAVPGYNALIGQYNRVVNQTKQEIKDYNDLLDERNKLVIQQQELYEVIDANSVNEKK